MITIGYSTREHNPKFIEYLKKSSGFGKNVEVIEISPNVVHKGELLRVHTPEYIEEVLEQHRSSEWDGKREDLANLASKFVQGTL